MEVTALEILELAADLIASGEDWMSVIADAVRRLGVEAEGPPHREAFDMVTRYLFNYSLIPTEEAKMAAIMDAIAELRGRA